MTQKDKELLLKDICARLPYSVKCYPVITNGEPNTIGGYCEVLDDFYIREVGGWFPISMIKPYLRPMSSMTEEERKEWYVTFESVYDLVPGGNPDNEDDYDDNWHEEPGIESYDYLYAHHFDYRGLIEKGLALVSPDNMYK